MSDDEKSVHSNCDVDTTVNAEAVYEESDSDSSSSEIEVPRTRRRSQVVRTISTIVFLLYELFKRLGVCKNCSETVA